METRGAAHRILYRPGSREKPQGGGEGGLGMGHEPGTQRFGFSPSQRKEENRFSFKFKRPAAKLQRGRGHGLR